MRYLWDYSDRARDLIRAMKYQPSIYLTRYCAHLMIEYIPHLFGELPWDLIIPVPSSPKMLRKRLFHPCLEMAKILSCDLSSAKVSHQLRHEKTRAPQATLNHGERLRGLTRFFRVRCPDAIRGRSVLLVEDVITTGATIAAASHALYQAGATRVDVVAIAQARVWSRFRARIFKALPAHEPARTDIPSPH